MKCKELLRELAGIRKIIIVLIIDVGTTAICEDNDQKEKDLPEKNDSDDDSYIDELR